ncbi:hypothetical protein [Streptomyces fuscichromogenes]|uniref:Uncharacterized protein n=1 Tax=Streptomyces fuscichromogenes TaxID=1324013 RepID=A0A917XPG6_9ACTN|nr:hypothetical protein [Streptomyces fuscichromogenes]GGN46716.1 hypothetical protein GCM10011578_099780 [Streptomyces fuscichromogenes]
MTQRFENAGLVLGPVDGRSAGLCRFAGRSGAEQNTTALAVVDAALAIAEQVEGVEDVWELLGLWDAAHVWGHPAVPDVELSRLSEANTAVAGRLQNLLERLAPEQLRELGIALSVDHDMVALALELVEETAAGRREFQASTMAEFEAENRQNEDRIGDAVDVLLLDAPGGWPPLQRAALTLALVWDLADLIAYAARLSAVDVLPAALLWQAPGADHMCASARVPVPGTELLVWAQIDPESFDGRPLWSQGATVGLWRWSLDWERADGSKVYYKGGRSPSQAAARWEAQWATQELLNDPHRAKSPMTGDPLIVPR